MPSITYANTNDEILREIGDRLHRYRLQQNVTVAEVALQAGVSSPTVINLEKGRNTRLDSLVRILRVLGKLDALDALPPAPEVSPIQLARLKGRVRQRARRPRRG